MKNNRTILITGVTGNQGGAVAQALEGTGFNLRGLTRKPDSERAAALAHRGVDIVKGDLDDEATLRRALAGAWGVFGVQNAGEAGVEREEAQGKRLATLAGDCVVYQQRTGPECDPTEIFIHRLSGVNYRVVAFLRVLINLSPLTSLVRPAE